MEGNTDYLICGALVNNVDQVNGEYDECGNPAKYKATYTSGTSGKRLERIVCGVHLLSIKKYRDRMKKKCDYDVGLVIEELGINHPSNKV